LSRATQGHSSALTVHWKPHLLNLDKFIFDAESYAGA
jgi:hypothetical protein